jgi:hypothetical protein
MDPVTLGIMAAGTGLSALNRMTQRRAQPAAPPAITDAQVRQMQQGALSQAADVNMGGASMLGRMMRFGGAPPGSVAAAQSGQAYQSARGAARATPQFLGMQRESLERRSMAEEEAARYNAQLSDLTPEIGSMTQAMMLYSQGLLDPSQAVAPGQPAPQQVQQQPYGGPSLRLGTPTFTTTARGMQQRYNPTVPQPTPANLSTNFSGTGFRNKPGLYGTGRNSGPGLRYRP